MLGQIGWKRLHFFHILTILLFVRLLFQILFSEDIKKLNIHFNKEADEKGQLYGAISKNEIINLLKENDIQIHSDDIIISEQIRSIGEHKILVNPYIDIKESILIKVSKN